MNSRQNHIQIIDPDIVAKRKDLLAFIDHWKRALNIVIGWHYDLDLIDILSKIEAMGLPRGSWIMDAGAGNGLLQFLLAAKGYNVMSVDFSDRDIPWEARKIFRINRCEAGDVDDHRYRDFIRHGRFKLNSQLVGKFAKKPFRSLRRAAEITAHTLDPLLWKEIFKRDPEYGEIVYARGDFTNLNQFKNGTFDCVVSVSAVEHNDIDKIALSIREFERVAKPSAPLIITTSAIKDRDLYLEHCQAWCFTSKKLREIFDMKECPDNYDSYDVIFDKLVKNEIIRSRIPRLYYENGDNGLPWGKYPPLYQPVSIVKYVV